MKTKKLWLWSIFFGLCATVILYFVLNQEDPSVPASGSPDVSSEDSNNEEDGTNDTTNKANAEENKEKEEFIENVMLPVEEGKRAMSITVNVPQGVTGFVDPGNYVDVIAKIVPPEKEEEEEETPPEEKESAVMIIQDVRVLAVGHAADTEAEMKLYEHVTLEVTPEEGLALGFATKYPLYLMIRSEDDHDVETENYQIQEEQLREGVFRP